MKDLPIGSVAGSKGLRNRLLRALLVWRRPAGPGGEGEAVDLDEKKASRVPRVPWPWSVACWTVFFGGLACVLWGLVVLGFGGKKEGVKLALVLVLPAAIVMAAVNTFVAATWFQARRRELAAWVKGRLDSYSTSSGDKQRHFEWRMPLTEVGRLAVQYDPGMRCNVQANGIYMPEPYRTAGYHVGVRFDLVRYLDLLQAEVHAARTVAAKLAGALGGLFVTALQVYGKLV